MSRALFGIVAIVLVGTPVLAAELDYPGPAVPSYHPAYQGAAPLLLSWSGWYVGLNAGGAWGSAGETTAANPAFVAPTQFPVTGPFLAGIETTTINPSGFTGGGQIGANYQAGNLVAGFEADLEYFGLHGGALGVGPATSPAGDVVSGTLSVSTDFLATARGRLGWAFGQTMLYGTGGVAVSGINFNDNVTITRGGITGVLTNTTKTTAVGWTAGGGIEHMVAPGWILRLEYLHVDLGSETTIVPLTGALATGRTGCVGCATSTQTRLWSDVVRAGISWKFGGYTSGS